MGISLRSLLGAGVGIFLLGGLIAHPAAAAPQVQAEDNMTKLGQMSGADFEKMFLSMMIEHHQGAVEMANLVPDRAKHQELKDLGGNIIRSQSKEIKDMTGWLQSWYSMAPQKGMMSMSGMGMDMGKLQSLQGDGFDQEFLTQMRTHHASAVEMAQLVPSRATHQELKDLAQAIISSQTKEIADMTGWLKSWYGIDLAQSGTTMGGMTGGTMGGMTGGTMGGTTGGTTALPSTGNASTLPWWLPIAGFALLAVLVGGLLRARRPSIS